MKKCEFCAVENEQILVFKEKEITTRNTIKAVKDEEFLPPPLVVSLKIKRLFATAAMLDAANRKLRVFLDVYDQPPYPGHINNTLIEATKRINYCPVCGRKL